CLDERHTLGTVDQNADFLCQQGSGRIDQHGAQAVADRGGLSRRAAGSPGIDEKSWVCAWPEEPLCLWDGREGAKHFLYLWERGGRLVGFFLRSPHRSAWSGNC